MLGPCVLVASTSSLRYSALLPQLGQGERLSIGDRLLARAAPSTVPCLPGSSSTSLSRSIPVGVSPWACRDPSNWSRTRTPGRLAGYDPRTIPYPRAAGRSRPWRRSPSCRSASIRAGAAGALAVPLDRGVLVFEDARVEGHERERHLEGGLWPEALRAASRVVTRNELVRAEVVELEAAVTACERGREVGFRLRRGRERNEDRDPRRDETHRAPFLVGHGRVKRSEPRNES